MALDGVDVMTPVLTAETCMMLDDLRQLDHATVSDVLAKAVAAYWGQRIMEEHNAAYAALRQDPEGWREECAERALWETTLMDGLDDACAR